jgi:TolB protein
LHNRRFDRRLFLALSLVAAVSLGGLLASGAVGGTEPAGLLVFDSSDGLHTVKSDGTGLKTLVGTGSADSDPRWSPDGKKIAFWNGEADGGSSSVDEHVYTSNPNGTNRRRIAIGEYPVWSPNGKLIAFDSALDGDWHVYVINANGTNLRRIDTGRFAGYYPSFQSNTRLSFDAGGANVKPNADYTAQGIWVVNLNGSGLAPLKTVSVNDTDGAWSRNGKMLAFTTYVKGKGEIGVASLDGKVVKKLTHNTIDDYDPVWTPDGAHILFTSGRSGDDEIYIMNTDGTDAHRITHFPSQYAEEADWRP